MLRRSHWFYGLQFARKSSLPYHHFARTCTIFDGHQRFLARCLPGVSRWGKKKAKSKNPLYYAGCIVHRIPSMERDRVKRLIVVLSGFLHYGFLEKGIYVHLSSRPPRQKINSESFPNEWPRVHQEWKNNIGLGKISTNLLISIIV